MIPIGLQNEVTYTVSENHTAITLESGNARVLSTPYLAASLEKAAHELCFPYLEEGTATVGTHLNLNHLAATPVGMKVTAKATVTEADGRKIVFHLEAFDEREKIAEGTHTRFIIQSEKFQARCDAKLEP
ncbi:MAG: thioesterase family protein [Clostridia bacterium]|nr:thioesterase family protein [Clostridia bacterium]